MTGDITIRAAQSGDIYIDRNGTLWRIVGRVNEPSIFAESVESYPSQNQFGVGPMLQTTLSYKQKLNGGVTGLMWDGWVRIHRPEHGPSGELVQAHDCGKK